jgi:type IV secretory pathway VirB2 component (pilin)
MRDVSRPVFVVALLQIVMFPLMAWAGPGGGPLVGFGEQVVDFLTGPLAIIVGIVGIALAAISLLLGNRDGFMKAGYAVVGAAMLFGARQIIDWVASGT